MKRRFLVPETVQTSAIDCGPASLHSLLLGFGLAGRYDSLRDACHTDVDGTSIDVVEDVARARGLDAEQVVVPVDHLLLPAAQCLPGVVVTREDQGLPHFVVAWSRVGPLVQIMDPAAGRQWLGADHFLRRVYRHEQEVDAGRWRNWAGTGDFLGPLRARLAALGVEPDPRITQATADTDWTGLARLDAATRAVNALVEARGIDRGRGATVLLDAFLAGERPVPDAYWSVRAGGAAGRLLVSGAVVVRIRGTGLPPKTDPSRRADAPEAAEPSPLRALVSMLRADGALAPAVVSSALLLATGGLLAEGLLLQALLVAGANLAGTTERLGALGVLAILLLALLLLDLVAVRGLLHLGRHLELRFRAAFLARLPLLPDRWFRSRPGSDLAERGHNLHLLRSLPQLGGAVLRAGFELLGCVLAITWIAPRVAPLAILAAILAVGLPLLWGPVLAERDLRARTHTGALLGFYLDTLLGLVVVRAHAAESALRIAHEALLVRWMRAEGSLLRAGVSLDAVTNLVGVGLAGTTVMVAAGDAGLSLLLLAWWALRIPGIGAILAGAVRAYPDARSVTRRLLEPLDAGPTEAEAHRPPPAGAPHLVWEDVGVTIGRHRLLTEVNLEVAAGRHVAVVGTSGAGKSTLFGTLLGWSEPSSGTIRVDGAPLDVVALRPALAWVDPQVHLWNRSFLDNLRYGSAARPDLAPILDAAQLGPVLERLPQGTTTPLGEGGGRLSGGEGQRVRLGRALGREGVRLVLLDEPFTGLDRNQRHELLHAVREHWAGATLLCATHDVNEALGFDTVVVMAAGRVVETGDPGELAARPDSAFAGMLAAERAVATELTAGGTWRRLHLADGVVAEEVR